MDNSKGNDVPDENMKQEFARSDSVDMFESQLESPSYDLHMNSDDDSQPSLGQKMKLDFGVGEEESENDSGEASEEEKSKKKIMLEDAPKGRNDGKMVGAVWNNVEGSLPFSSGESPSGAGANDDENLPKGELSLDELVEQLQKKMNERKQLMTEIKKVDERIESMNKSEKLRKIRMEVQANIIKTQENELFQQSKDLPKEKTNEGAGSLDMKVIRDGIKKIVQNVDELGRNVERLVDGREQKGEGSKLNELKIMSEKWNSVTIFCPGSLEDQPEEIRKELSKTNMKIVYCVDEGIKKMVSAMKNIEIEGGTEGNLGVCILKCGKGGGPEDEDVIKNAIKKFMAQLEIMVTRGREKFEELVLVIPPATEKNWKIIMKLENEVTEKMKQYKIVSLLKEQTELGKKEEGDSDKVFEREGQMFSRKYAEEEGEMFMNTYSFRRCLAKVALIGEKEETVGDLGCTECGFNHQGTTCLLT